MDHLADAFRKLRRAWFNACLRSYGQEREWETEEEEQRRKERNDELFSKYDTDTEAIIAGHDRPIDPRCAADMTV